jgi:hypothetical protein
MGKRKRNFSCTPKEYGRKDSQLSVVTTSFSEAVNPNYSNVFSNYDTEY